MNLSSVNAQAMLDEIARLRALLARVPLIDPVSRYKVCHGCGSFGTPHKPDCWAEAIAKELGK